MHNIFLRRKEKRGGWGDGLLYGEKRIIEEMILWSSFCISHDDQGLAASFSIHDMVEGEKGFFLD